MEDNRCYSAHRLGFCIDEKYNIRGLINIDSFRIVNELINLTSHYGLELEVEHEVDSVEDLLMCIQAFGRDVIELFLYPCFEDLLDQLRGNLYRLLY